MIIVTVLIMVSIIYPAGDVFANTPLYGYYYDTHASSTLAEGKVIYSAENIIPPSLSHAWCEGVKGEGVGEWIELTLKEPAKGDMGLAILSGYAKNDWVYKNNGRPKKLQLMINDRIEQEIGLEDIPREQLFRINNPTSESMSKVRIVISEVYPGLKYEDTCLTEVLLLPIDGYVQEYSSEESAREAARVVSLLEKAKAGNLDAIEELVRMSGGSYIMGAEGGEWLYEIYLELFVGDPYKLLFVTLKQNDKFKSKVFDAIINPISDRYTSTKLLNCLDGAINNGIDASSVKVIKTGLSQRKKALND